MATPTAAAPKNAISLEQILQVPWTVAGSPFGDGHSASYCLIAKLPQDRGKILAMCIPSEELARALALVPDLVEGLEQAMAWIGRVREDPSLTPGQDEGFAGFLERARNTLVLAGGKR